MKKVLALMTVLFFLLAQSAYSQICNGDFDFDNDVDGTDAVTFKNDFWRKDCPDDGPAPVEKTRQITCYDTDGNPRDCAGTGEDGEHQKGVEWPVPRFTDNGDETVTDNLTGLIWQKEANCIATSYPGFDNDDTEGDGRVTWQHALDFVAGINDGTYPDCGAGMIDWRLPNYKELFSLIDAEYFDPAVPNTAGTGQGSEGDPFANQVSSSYWSSTTFASYPSYAWSVYFYGGHVSPSHKRSDYPVRAVRGGQ